jgi:hypothetical protein
MELADRRIAGAVQPFHAAERLDLPQAEKLIERCRRSTDALAEHALHELLAELKNQGLRVAGASVLLAAGRPLGTLQATLASHALIHTAEGEFFREAVRRAAAKYSLPVTGIKEREVFDRGQIALGRTAAQIQESLAELGRPLGPPWRQDEKLAALAAWLVLATA